MIDKVTYRDGECQECAGRGEGVEFVETGTHAKFLCFDCFEAVLEEEEEGVPDFTIEEEAIDAVKREAERLGVDVSEILDPNRAAEYSYRSVLFRKALQFFASTG